MVRVLVLTKNILAEEVITKKLQHLNYEVFCSTSILEELQSNGHMSELVNYFPIIIIGETISSYEMEIMLPKLKKHGQRILREMDHPLSEDEKGQLLNHGLSGYVQSNDSIESLRENLAEVMASYQNHEPGEVEAYLEEEPRGISAITLINLSTLELQVLEKLRSKPGEIISRDELCMTLWGNVSQSRLAQLSSLVKNIKLKLEILEIDKEVIQTIWGKGYRVMQDSIVQNK